MDNAFSDCSDLSEVHFPATIEFIGSEAFANCENLEWICLGHDYQNIGNSDEPIYNLSVIKNQAFAGCSSLKSIDLSECNELAVIGYKSFERCSTLSRVDLPSKLNKIEAGAFKDCSSLTDLYMPEELSSLESIYGYFDYWYPSENKVAGVFEGCSSLRTIKLPSGITSIPAATFKNCTSLKNIEIPEGVLSIESYRRYPDEYEETYNGAFEGCSSLQSIVLPDGLTEIGEGAFLQCSLLLTIDIPESVLNIGGYAFFKCTNLTNISLPYRLTSIGSNCFYDCPNITGLILKSVYPPLYKNDRAYFEDNVYRQATLIVPEESLNLYQSTYPWSRFENIVTLSDTYVDDQEWELLKLLKSELLALCWDGDWNTEEDKSAAERFSGVQLSNSHVVGINLSQQYLLGKIPLSVFRFPHIKTIDLSNNLLEDNLSESVGALLSENPELCRELTVLDLSHNRLSGNLSDVANKCSNLQSLSVSFNYISDIFPPLSRDFTFLDYEFQEIDHTIDLEFPMFSQAFIDSIPSIMRYNHANKSYIIGNFENPINLQLPCVRARYDEKSEDIPLVLNGDFVKFGSFGYSEYGYWFKGGNGQLYPLYGRSSSKCKVRFTFKPGDTDFDGCLNISDLQKIIKLAFDICWRGLTNFTAADLTTDGKVNVSDVVAMVNLLMADERSEAQRPPMRSAGFNGGTDDEIETPEADITCGADGIVLTSERPMAAFDIIVANTADADLSGLRKRGFVCESKYSPNGLHIIGYSLSGATLPAGRNVIPAVFGGAGGAVRYAALCDEEGAIIPATLDRGVESSVTSISDSSAIISMADGILSIEANPCERLIWSAFTPDGKLLNSGEALTDYEGKTAIRLEADGIIILRINTHAGTITKKINYIK